MRISDWSSDVCSSDLDLTLLNAVPLACCVGAHENQDERIDDRVAADGLTHDLVALSRDVPHLAEVDRAPVGDCFTDHKAAAQCVVRTGFEGAIRHLLHAVDVKPEGEDLARRNGVNSQDRKSVWKG